MFSVIYVYPCHNVIDCEPYTTDLSPDEHTLLMVVQGILVLIPPLIDACLAGACPIPEESTLPRMTSLTSVGLK